MTREPLAVIGRSSVIVLSFVFFAKERFPERFRQPSPSAVKVRSPLCSGTVYAEDSVIGETKTTVPPLPSSAPIAVPSEPNGAAALVPSPFPVAET